VSNVSIVSSRYAGRLLGHEQRRTSSCHSVLATHGDKDDVAGEDDAVTNSWQSDCTGASGSEIRGLMRQSQGASLAAALSKAMLRQAVWTALGDGGSGDGGSGDSDREHFELSVSSLETEDRSDRCSSDS
jgi:hypothetical protein